MSQPYPHILGKWQPSIMIRWDVATLDYVFWDGSLTTGAITIGTVDQGTGGASPWRTMSGLMIVAHDFIGLSYTGSNLTSVAFKTGGSGGTTVATLTLAYTGSRLDSVTKT